jgi:hypothetical protein
MAKSRRQSNDSLETRLSDLETGVKWQKKTGAVATLGFNNLEIGKTYRLTVSGNYSYSNTADGSAVWTHNGADLIRLSWGMNSGGNEEDGSNSFSASTVFIATANTITAAETGSSWTGEEAILEELPFHTVTSEWT